MKKSICRILFACLILILPAIAQQVNQDIIPASTGLNIGHSNQRWNGFFQNINISGTCTLNNHACFGGGAGSVTSITATGDGTVLSSTPTAPVTTSGTLNLTLANAPAGMVLNNMAGTAAQPIWTNSVVLGLNGGGGYSGELTLLGSTSGSTSLTVAPAAGTYTSRLPLAVGTAGQCLQSNGGTPEQWQWGACGSGAPNQALPASPLINQGASVTPIYVGGVNYATTVQNWSQTGITTSLTGCPTGVACATQTLTLNAGFSGIDVISGFGYQVYITDGANSEAVNVTGGTYTFAGGGTITFVPFFNHGPGAYTVGSASSGIQETLNAACGVNATTTLQGYCNVTIPATGPYGPNFPNSLYVTYNIPGTIFVHYPHTVISGYGAVFACTSRGPCVVIGSTKTSLSSNEFVGVTLKGIRFRSPTDFSAVAAYSGSNISNTSKTTQVVTVTTASAHGFRPGELIAQMFTDDVRYWGDKIVATVPDSTHYTYNDLGADILSAATPGVVALAYEPILDTQTGTTFTDIAYDHIFEAGKFNQFFDFWDDEDATITGFANFGISLHKSATWSGSFIYSGGNPPGATQWAPVITIRDSSITANSSNCATIFNNNGFYLDNVVCQASGLWQVYDSNINGNFQGASIRNIYSESTANANPVSPLTPYPDTGIAGLIAVNRTGTGNDSITGNGGMSGAYPVHGAGVANHFQYFIVVNDTTAGTHTSPMRVLQWNSSGVDAPVVKWPRVANLGDTMTYDVLRVDMGASITIGTVFPYIGGCTGGSVTACGSVAVGITQAVACSGGLVCSFTDNPALNTTSYTINPGTYTGTVAYWPGAIVSSKTIQVDQAQSPLTAVALAGNQGSSPVIQIANNCGAGFTTASGYTTCATSQGSNSLPAPSANVLDDISSNPSAAIPKGKLIFRQSSGFPHQFITFMDANQEKTLATIGYRPNWDTADTWVGSDIKTGGVALTSGRLAFGSPVAISNYINVIPNFSGAAAGTNWVEQVTATGKFFNVPININGATSGAAILGATATGGGLTLNSQGALTGVQGTDANILSAGTVAGAAGTALCIDANAGATTTGCTGGAVTASGPPVANQVAFFTSASNITGATDFTIAETGTHSLTVPPGCNTTTGPGGLMFSGITDVGIGSASGILCLMAGSGNQAQFYRKTGVGTYAVNFSITSAAAAATLASVEAQGVLNIRGAVTTTTGAAGYDIRMGKVSGTDTAMSGTSGVQAGTMVFGAFAPASGTAAYDAFHVNPVINQTGGANGTIRIGAFYPVNTALVGTEYLIAAGTAASQAANAVLTDKFTVDNSGNVVSQGSVTATTSVKGATYLTATNCTANGTAANPSVVSCSAAPAGAFSCDVAASAGTCTVNTTAVTANSEIAVRLNSYTGTRLTVTCNTAPSAVPAIYVASIVAGTSFTINMPTITVNPACFDFTIVN